MISTLTASVKENNHTCFSTSWRRIYKCTRHSMVYIATVQRYCRRTLTQNSWIHYTDYCIVK